MSRTNTPDLETRNPDGSTTTVIRLKRACNACGNALGDATDLEVTMAVQGVRLPDVRDECGCEARQ